MSKKHKNAKQKSPDIIFGRNACISVLKNQKRIIKSIYIESDNQNIQDLIKKSDIKIDYSKIIYLSKMDMEKLTKSTDKHQGIAIASEGFSYKSIQNIKHASDNTRFSYFMLDSLSDPHNIGAIMRSAYAFGVDGIVMQDMNTSRINSSVIRSSAGYSEEIDIFQVCNLASTIEHFKSLNYWIIALECENEDNKDKLTKNMKHLIKSYENAVYILGSEGTGVRRMLSKSADFSLAIDMCNNTESLNVAVTASIIAYELFAAKVCS